MIKALFFDLDGTLLNSEKKISQRTRTALEKCREKGYKLFLATARPPLLDRMLSWDKSMLSIFDGGTYYNGGCIKIGKRKEYLPVSDHIVHKIIDCVNSYDNYNIALQLADEKHAFRFGLEDKGYRSWGVNSEEALMLSQAGKNKTIKIIIFTLNLIDSVEPITDNLVASLEKMCVDEAQLYLTDSGKCIQIMGKSVNKLNSVETIRKNFGFEKDEIAVFGDDTNDEEMLSEYKYSIAMRNATDHVKKTAGYVTLDNNRDGIEYAIANILKLL